jgi:uncharacterized protein
VAQKTTEEKLVLSDASPLIGLAAAGAFPLLKRLFGTVSITHTVRDEVSAGAGRPGAAQSRAAIEAGWMQVLADFATEPSFAELGPGETRTLRAALAAKADTLVILDGAMARLAATRHGVAHVGSLGVIVAAKQRGLVRMAVPYFERLAKSGFYLPTSVLKGLLRDLGEGA